MINQDTHSGPSFPLSNRMARALWQLCSFLFTLSPRPFHRWRAFILRTFGAKVGHGVHVYPKVTVWAPWNLVLGDECGIGNGVILYNQETITIGKRAVVSQGSHLCTGTHDYTLPGFPLQAYPIHIGDHAWVAADCFIHPGVRIGEGCVVGARSVVHRNMPSWQICAGHPCKPIKERILHFTEPSNQLDR